MTKEECAQLIRLNFVLYKLSQKPLTDKELAATVQVWHWHFGALPGPVVREAFLRANGVCRFPVQPADVLDQLRQMAAARQPAPAARWQALKEAARRAVTLAERRTCPLVVGLDAAGRPVRDDGTAALAALYAGLDETDRAFCGSAAGLVQLGRCGETEQESYRRAAYLAHCQAADARRTPAQVAALLAAPASPPEPKTAAAAADLPAAPADARPAARAQEKGENT